MTAVTEKLTTQHLTTKEAPTWCFGCGDYSILSVIKSCLVQLNLEQHNTLLVSGIGCLPPEEKVSVGDSWVTITELKNTQAIINGDGNFTDVLFKTVNHFEGDIIEIVPFVSPFNTIRLTPEHPVLSLRRNSIRSRNQIDKRKLSKIKPEFADAGSLQSGDYMVFNWNREVKDNIAYTNDFCRLLGYYLAEGSVNEGGGRNRDSANVSFALNSNENEIIDDISDLSIKLTGRKPYIRIRKEIGKVAELTICSKSLALLLKRLGGKGAGNKKLTEEIMLLPSEKQKEIVEAYFKGDGYSGIAPFGKRRYFRANTLSVSLAIQMQEMLARLGIFASIYSKKMKPHNYKGRIIKPHGDQYYIAYQPEKEFSSVQKTKYGFLIPIKNTNKIPYKGLVHNLETSKDPHSYLVKGFVVHNCGSKTPHFIRTYGFEGLHGRTLPVATGAKIANTKLNVIAVAGDGDAYGIGGNHFIHTARRNLDITLIVQDNAIYGLTKGQTSPTSQKGFKSNSTPEGAIEDAFNPILMSIAGGATYVARGFAFDAAHLTKLIANGIKHRGFSVIDVLQPCTTYNKINTLDWYKANIYKLEEAGHDPGDKHASMKRAEEWSKKRIPIGLFYEEIRPTYEDSLPQAAVPLAKQDINSIDIRPLLNKFK